jgi:hypothetical protein
LYSIGSERYVPGAVTGTPVTAIAADEGSNLDPGWPPVLIAFVFAIIAVVVVVGVVMYRQARAARNRR